MCTWPPELVLHMEARKVELDGHTYVPRPFSLASPKTACEGDYKVIYTPLQIHCVMNLLIYFLYFIQRADKIIASCNHCTTYRDISARISAKLKMEVALKSRNEILEKPRFVVQQKQGGISHLEIFPREQQGNASPRVLTKEYTLDEKHYTPKDVFRTL